MLCQSTCSSIERQREDVLTEGLTTDRDDEIASRKGSTIAGNCGVFSKGSSGRDASKCGWGYPRGGTGGGGENEGYGEKQEIEIPGRFASRSPSQSKLWLVMLTWGLDASSPGGRGSDRKESGMWRKTGNRYTWSIRIAVSQPIETVAGDVHVGVGRVITRWKGKR